MTAMYRESNSFIRRASGRDSCDGRGFRKVQMVELVVYSSELSEWFPGVCFHFSVYYFVVMDEGGI